MYDVDGAKLRTWRLAERINDLIVCPDGKSLLYIEKDKKINVLRLNEEREVQLAAECSACSAHCRFQAGSPSAVISDLTWQVLNDQSIAARVLQLTTCCNARAKVQYLQVLTLTDGPAITNLAVSPGGAYLIVHMVSHTLHLWPLSSITRRLDSLAPATSARACGLSLLSASSLLPWTWPVDPSHRSKGSACHSSCDQAPLLHLHCSLHFASVQGMQET